MWQIGRTYTFVPSGDASELHLRIVAKVPFEEGRDWYEKTYNRPFDMDSNTAFKAIVVVGGHDADTYHCKGSIYYVFDTDFGSSHSQPEGLIVVSEETVDFDPKTMGPLITGLGEYRKERD